MTNAKNDEITAYTRDAKPTPLHEVMRPLFAVAFAPIAVPMRPRIEAATTAQSAPAMTAPQLIGHTTHSVLTDRSSGLSLITKNTPA